MSNDFCFKGVDEKYISVNKHGARWTEYSTGDSATFTRFSLKKA